MNTLHQAVQEYLSMRRALGFSLREAGKGLLDFVTFMEQHRTSFVTQALAWPGRNDRRTFNRRTGLGD